MDRGGGPTCRLSGRGLGEGPYVRGHERVAGDRVAPEDHARVVVAELGVVLEERATQVRGRHPPAPPSVQVGGIGCLRPAEYEEVVAGGIDIEGQVQPAPSLLVPLDLWVEHALPCAADEGVQVALCDQAQVGAAVDGHLAVDELDVVGGTDRPGRVGRGALVRLAVVDGAEPGLVEPGEDRGDRDGAGRRERSDRCCQRARAFGRHPGRCRVLRVQQGGRRRAAKRTRVRCAWRAVRNGKVVRRLGLDVGRGMPDCSSRGRSGRGRRRKAPSQAHRGNNPPDRHPASGHARSLSAILDVRQPFHEDFRRRSDRVS